MSEVQNLEIRVAIQGVPATIRNTKDLTSAMDRLNQEWERTRKEMREMERFKVNPMSSAFRDIRQGKYDLDLYKKTMYQLGCEVDITQKKLSKLGDSILTKRQLNDSNNKPPELNVNSNNKNSQSRNAYWWGGAGLMAAAMVPAALGGLPGVALGMGMAVYGAYLQTLKTNDEKMASLLSSSLELSNKNISQETIADKIEQLELKAQRNNGLFDDENKQYEQYKKVYGENTRKQQELGENLLSEFIEQRDGSFITYDKLIDIFKKDWKVKLNLNTNNYLGPYEKVDDAKERFNITIGKLIDKIGALTPILSSKELRGEVISIEAKDAAEKAFKWIEKAKDVPGLLSGENINALSAMKKTIREAYGDTDQYTKFSIDLMNTATKEIINQEQQIIKAVAEQAENRTRNIEHSTQEQVQIYKSGTTQIKDSWKQIFDGVELDYRDPLQGFQEDVKNLRFDFQGISNAAKDSSKDIVKATKQAKESQVGFSNAVAGETQKAFDESSNYCEEYYDLLFNLAQEAYDQQIALEEENTQAFDDQLDERTNLLAQATKEQVQIQKSGTTQMLESWADMTKGWDEIGTNALQGIQQTLYQTFRNAFDGVGDFWEDLWSGLKNVALNVLASIATKMANGLIGNVVLNFIPGMSGGVGGSGGSGGAGGFSMPNIPSGAAEAAYNWMFHSYEAATMGAGGSQMGYGLANLGIDSAPTTGAGSAMGMAGGVAAAALSAYSLYDLYENGPGGATGAVQGAMTGAMGGLALGVQIGGSAGPWGAVIGAIVGALAGGLGGGGNEDVEDRIEDAKRFGKIAKELTRQANLDQDVDVDKYLEAINAGHRSDNRVDSEAMWALYNNLKSKDKLPWWAGDPGQIAHTQNLGATEWGQPDWMRYRLYGNDLAKETGDSGMIEWFSKDGEGGTWGGEGNWEKVKEALGALDDETLNNLGDGLFNVKEGAAAFGLDLTDLMANFNLAELESGEWATILRDELSPASLMAAMNDELRAQGMNNLEIAAQKQAAAIDSLLGSFNMSEEDTNSWIDQLFKANAEQSDLAAKMEEYQKIVEELKTLRAGEEEKAKDLIERGRQLREELGLGESAFSKITEGFDKFVEAMEEIADRLLKAAGGDHNKTHHGGYIYHSGGMVGAMLHAGLITPHGGMTRMHSGGLRPDERMAILQAGEFVVQRTSVNSDTLATLRSINATGRLPEDIASKVVGRFHSGGMIPGMSVQPQGGDNGKPVTINFSPQITVNAENGADERKIEDAVARALEKGRVALKRQLEQTGYQVVDAQ